MVDANGKEIPWVDVNGKILKTVSERYYYFEDRKLRLIPDLEERILICFLESPHSKKPSTDGYLNLKYSWLLIPGSPAADGIYICIE